MRIAFTGKAGSGKTTAARFLETVGFTRMSFAEALRATAQVLWGIEKGMSRDRLQKLGVAIREIDEDTWVNILLEGLPEDPAKDIVIDDLRFPNEYWALKEAGFVLVRITAPRNARIDRLRLNGKLEDESQLEHVSETALDGFEFDYTLVNDNTELELAQHLHRILHHERLRV